MFMGQNFSLAGTKLPSSIEIMSYMSFKKQRKSLSRCTTSIRLYIAHFGILTSSRMFFKSDSVVYKCNFYSAVTKI